MHHRIFLAFWSNLGNRVGHIERALQYLVEENILYDIQSSSYYRSSPFDATWGYYINSVISACTYLTPERLMRVILSAEERCGRRRYSYHNPRTIDIDILLYDDLIIDSALIILPHPRMTERLFVMIPLLEIFPDIRIPWFVSFPNTGYENQSIEKLHPRNISWKWKNALMGILNITPDSFSDGGRYYSGEVAFEHVEQMLAEWADIIDIGWQSTRPGASIISASEEIGRIEPILQMIRQKYPYVPISVDTSSSIVLSRILQYDIDIVNDVSGGTLDPHLLELVASARKPYILMSRDANIGCMMDYFHQMLRTLEIIWIYDVILDPGFWFAKNIEENYQILSSLGQIEVFGRLILVWISRKSMIYKPLGISPHEALNGTTALHMLAWQSWASLLRVHDVREASETRELYYLYEQNRVD